MRHVLLALAVGLCVPCVVARADDSSASDKGSGFGMRLGAYEDNFAGVKFDRRTGTAWWLEPDEKSPVNASKWTKMDETDALAPGDYDVQFAVMSKLKTSSIIRINRSTGATWMLIGSKWYPLRSN
jgi:hypothetical protein